MRLIPNCLDQVERKDKQCFSSMGKISISLHQLF